MGDTGIVADENSGLPEPAGKVVKVVDSYRAVELLFGSGQPMYRH
jgi:hypothetical protein